SAVMFALWRAWAARILEPALVSLGMVAFLSASRQGPDEPWGRQGSSGITSHRPGGRRASGGARKPVVISNALGQVRQVLLGLRREPLMGRLLGEARLERCAASPAVAAPHRDHVPPDRVRLLRAELGRAVRILVHQLQPG